MLVLMRCVLPGTHTRWPAFIAGIRQRNALRGVRLVVHDSVIDYIRRSGL